MEMLMGSQVKLLFIAAGITTVLGVSGAWSTWVTRTLINVDKNTEVMNVKLDANHSMLAMIMKNLSIERVTYGYVRD